MKNHSPAANRLLRPTRSTMKNGATVRIGPETAPTQPVIQVNRSENGVESIEVMCACGERILIRCDYE